MLALTFQMGREDYCLRISDVSEVLLNPSVISIPRVPAPFEGIFQLRGRVIALLNLSQYMGVAPEPAETEIVVLSSAGQYLAIRVPGLLETARLEAEETALPEDEALETFLDGIVCENQRIYHVLSVTKLLFIARNIISECENASRVSGG